MRTRTWYQAFAALFAASLGIGGCQSTADRAKNHADWKERVNAVLKLQDQALLADIAKTDRDRRVRKAAVLMITDENWLDATARLPFDTLDAEGIADCAAVGTEAVKRIKDSTRLTALAKDRALCGAVRAWAVMRTDDQAALEAIASETSPDCATSDQAVMQIKDQDALKRLALVKDCDISARAVERITDQPFLLTYITHWKDHSNRGPAAALSHLSDPKLLAVIVADKGMRTDIQYQASEKLDQLKK